MFSKLIKEIVRGKIFPCLFIFLYVGVIWWAVFSGQPIAIQSAWIITFLLGIIIIIVGIVTSLDAWQSPSWTVTRAKLTKCDVKKISSSDGSTYEPAVIYQFRIGDRHYMGTNYDFSDTSGSRIAATRKIESLKKLLDSEGYINVYYKPSEPELNVINPGIHVIHGIRLVFGLVLVGISLSTLSGIIQW